MDGTLDLQISSDTVPDLATANTDFLRVWDFILSFKKPPTFSWMMTLHIHL